MKSTIKLIIFDAAGVTWVGGYPWTCRFLAKKYHLPYKKVLVVMQDKWFLQACTGKMSSIVAFEKGAEDLKIPLSGRKLEELHLSLIKVRKEMLDFSQYLREHGYQTIILSNNYAHYIKKLRKKFKLDKYFDGVINSQELGINKTDPKMFNYTLSKFHAKPAGALYFDDQKENLIAPISVGINTILFKNVTQIKRDVLRLLKKYEKN